MKNVRYRYSLEEFIDDVIFKLIDNRLDFFIWCITTGVVIGVWWAVWFDCYIYNSFTDTFIMARGSKYIYAGLLLVSSLFYTYILQAEQNLKNEILAGLFPVECIFFLRYGKQYWYVIAAILGIALITDLVIFLKIKIDQRNTTKTTRGTTYRKRRINYQKVIRKMHTMNHKIISTASVCGVLFLLVIQVIVPAVKSRTYVSSKVTKPVYVSDEELWKEHEDLFRAYMSEEYENLDMQTKTNMAQEMVDMELAHLGCDPVQVCAKDIIQDGTAGYYSDRERRIVIDKTVLNGELGIEYLFDVIMHESHHCYAHTCVEKIDLDKQDVDIMFYRDVQEWRDNIKHYQDYEPGQGELAYQKYADQRLEASAREYAKYRSFEYLIYAYELTAKD